MSSNEFPTYAALGDRNAQKKNQQTLIEKFTSWFRNFLENAEWELKFRFIVNFKKHCQISRILAVFFYSKN